LCAARRDRHILIVRYLHISEGPTVDEADDVLVVADPAIIRDVMAVLSRHFARHGRVPERPTVVSLPPKPGDQP
jgi:hypothetical protein